mmetsp:Transcript_25068/g.42707  ORF Transcript_25068/g.42707 Transcript_25068/m.42707 type:complete len:85 (-) Transcript_25068:163-417(-)
MLSSGLYMVLDCNSGTRTSTNDHLIPFQVFHTFALSHPQTNTVLLGSFKQQINAKGKSHYLYFLSQLDSSRSQCHPPLSHESHS